MTIATLGERIRKLRKQKGMTLEELAGSELSKGMLSLIENNRAKPSMESLNYIAKRLGVEAAELLDEVSSKELRELLEKVEKIHAEIPQSIPEAKSKYKTMIRLIKPYLSKLTKGYEAARLLDLYGKSLIVTDQGGWEPYLEKAANIYDEMNLTARRAGIGILGALEKFERRKYQEALDILRKERKHIEENHAYIDPMTRLEFDYYQAILEFAVGDLEEALNTLESAIEFSRSEKIFYLIDDLYRLALGYATIYQDLEKIEYYSTKMTQYIAFSGDEDLNIYLELNKAERILAIEKDYETVIQICNRYLSNPDVPEYMLPFIYILKGQALYYRNQLTEALYWLEKAELPSVVNHPLDLSSFYIKDCIRALIYWKRKEKEKAQQLITLARKNLEALPWTPYHDFVKNTYEEIMEN